VRSDRYPAPALGDWVALLRRRYRAVAVAGVAAGILALAGGLLLPRWYRAAASVLPPQGVTDLLPTQDLATATTAASRARYAGGFTLFDVYVGILRSDTVARNVIGAHDLARHYRTTSDQRMLKTFRRHLGIQFSYEGIIMVSFEDRDPRIAADVANAMVDELDRLFRETLTTSARRQREFWESRAAASGARIDSLQAMLSAAQIQGGLTAMGQDASEATRAAGELVSRRMSLAVRLDMLTAWNMEDAPLMKSLQAELTAVDAEIARLPDVGVVLAEAIRDLRLAETLHEGIVTRVEQSQLEEARVSPVVEILDRAVPPDRATRPHRRLMAVAGTILGAGLALTWFTFRDGLG